MNRLQHIESIKQYLRAGHISDALVKSVSLGAKEIEDMMFDAQRDGRAFPKDFAALHDICDANELGGLCECELFDLIGEDRAFDFAAFVQNNLAALLRMGDLKPVRHFEE